MARFQSCLLICFVFLVASVNAATPSHGWHVHHQGNYYFFSDDALNWVEARDACAEQGGHLVEFGSAAEQEFVEGVFAQIPDGADHWIGLNDRYQEGRHVWENTGRPGFYTNWHSNQPDNLDGEGRAENCVQIYGSHWNDLFCDKIRKYVCEL